MKQSLTQKLQQKLTPQQIMLMKLIQLPSSELEAEIKKELEENPVIEDAAISNESSESDDDYEVDENVLGEEDYYHESEEEVATTASDSSGSGPQFFSLSVKESFQEELLDQVGIKIDTEPELTIAKYLVGSLDDSGYLRRDIGSIVDDLAFTQFVDTTEEKVEEVLGIVQQLDPAGVGARDLQESLLLQLQRKDQHNLIVRNATYIVENLFDDFTHKRFEKIEQKINISESDLKEVLNEIKSLNPKPGEPQSEMDRDASGIIPDFTVSIDGEELIVSLNNSSVPDLNINSAYIEMVESKEKKSKKEKETVSFIKKKVESAKWFIEALKQREETLKKTMVAIAHRQEAYFLSGDEKLIRPMILKDISDIIDMDISTVSRVVNSKYVQSPYGIFKLKKFFSESFTKDSGEEVSTLQVKEILKEIIENEDKSDPKKDDEIMKILNDKGYPIARRTVAKYREQLGIPVARMRRNL